MSSIAQVATFELERGQVPVQARDFYHGNGFVHIRGAIGDSLLSRLKHAYEEIVGAVAAADAPDISYSPSARGGQLVQRFYRLNSRPPFRDAFGDIQPTMLTIARGLLGDDARMVPDGEGGGTGTVMIVKHTDDVGPHNWLPWHSDGAFTRHLPIFPYINAGLYLDDSDASKGCLVVVPHSQRDFAPSDELGNGCAELADEVQIEARAGDIVVHSSEIWHCSRTSTAPGAIRRVLYVNFTQRAPT
jgi:hypothetical protein